MDATAAIVIFLFVVTIFSSLGGNKNYTSSVIQPEVSSQLEESIYISLDPSYFAAVGEDVRSSIQNYISKYRKADETEAITASIMKYSQAYDVNPKLVAALMARESRFNPTAVSKSGAVGLGQLLSSTCKTVGISDPYDIDQNAKGTVYYLKYLLDRFQKYSQRIVFAIGGYLEGPNAVERALGYKPQTRAYIKDIIDIYHKI